MFCSVLFQCCSKLFISATSYNTSTPVSWPWISSSPSCAFNRPASRSNAIWSTTKFIRLVSVDNMYVKQMVYLKIDKTKVLKTDYPLMHVLFIAEWSILQYFKPALSNNRWSILQYFKPALSDNRWSILQYFNPALSDNRWSILQYFRPALSDNRS